MDNEENTSAIQHSTLEAILDNHNATLESVFRRIYPDADLGRELAAIDNALDNNLMTAEQLQDEFFSYTSSSAPDLIFLPFKHACIYTRLSQHAYERADRERAWSFLSNARELLGMAHTAIYFKDTQNTPQKTINNARAGGRAKTRLHDPVKHEVARQLMETKPDGGWKTKSGAASTVANLESVRDVAIRGAGMSEPNLTETIRQWMGKDPVVSDAYKRSSSSSSTPGK